MHVFFKVKRFVFNLLVVFNLQMNENSEPTILKVFFSKRIIILNIFSENLIEKFLWSSCLNSLRTFIKTFRITNLTKFCQFALRLVICQTSYDNLFIKITFGVL